MKLFMILSFYIASAIGDCLNGNGDVLTFGGMDTDRMTTNSIGLVTTHLVNLSSDEFCIRPELPVDMKEAHIFEYDDTLLLCTSFTRPNMEELQCFIWSDGEWLTFPTPSGNRMFPFISAVKIPNVGIWFMGNKFGETLMLNGDREWSEGPEWTNVRTRACSVLISDTKVARIGGQTVKKLSETIAGDTIDVMDFSNPTDPTESITVARMGWERKHLSCALIPKGENDNPTVAILGDNSPPYPFEMELWDTITNEITTVPHPPGYENYRFFRPVMATYDDNSIILAGSRVIDDDGESYMSEIFLYEFGTGWINLGEIEPPLEAQEQFGIYILKEPVLPALDSLTCCSE